ncbi:MAG: hypothetical protein IT280_12290 [Ignavibacteria bacterium]|nr:hypothetical protein [Ignavibacteria bacterium]
MKKIIFIICIFVSMQVLSQNISKLENLKLHKSYLPIEAQIKIIQQNIISCLGNNNEILKQIREGVYQFSNNIKEIDGSPYLQLVNSKDKKVITSFKLIKSRDKNGALNYSVNYKDVSRLSTEDLSRFSVPIV